MNALTALKLFLNRVENDPRIRSTHISAYMALYQEWLSKGCPPTFDVTRHKLMALAKISSSATWHRAIRALDEYGYINYTPTFNKMKKSTVSIYTSHYGRF